MHECQKSSILSVFGARWTDLYGKRRTVGAVLLLNPGMPKEQCGHSFHKYQYSYLTGKSENIELFLYSCASTRPRFCVWGDGCKYSIVITVKMVFSEPYRAAWIRELGNPPLANTATPTTTFAVNKPDFFWHSTSTLVTNSIHWCQKPLLPWKSQVKI